MKKKFRSKSSLVDGLQQNAASLVTRDPVGGGMPPGVECRYWFLGIYIGSPYEWEPSSYPYVNRLRRQ